MKIAVIGAGVRAPLLANGLVRSDLPIDEIALFDTDPERLAVIARLAASYAPCVRAYGDPEPCVEGSAFVFLSIRAGGISARARDEAVAIARGAIGQETVGPAGFAMAMRNIPAAAEYARLVARVAPEAWIVNFTNPVGIITQAMWAAGGGRVIGICDTPTELFEEVARALAIPSSRCFFDYFGLNHLGWLREVYSDGVPQLARFWGDPARLARVYRAPLFDPAALASLRMLPTEYVFFYERTREALANLAAAGTTRGAAIAELTAHLFHDLASAGAEARAVYEAYLHARSAGYMQLESGASQPLVPSPSAELTGYDKIALAVVRAIHGNTNAIIPLDVPNRGAIRDLADTDVVEVPCVVNANGARPLVVGRLPEAVRDLVVRIKEYERFTIGAALAPSMDAAVRALAHNPLVGTHALARRLVDGLQPLW